MGRRRVTSVEELTDHVLYLVRENGVHGLTSRGIAHQAGIAVGTVYRHVADLDSLVANAARTVEQAFLADLCAAAPDTVPLRPALPAVARAVVARARTEPHLTELLTGAPASTLDHDSRTGAQIRVWIAHRVRHAALAGEVDVTDPELVAAAAFGQVRAVLELCLHRPAAWASASEVLTAGLRGLLAGDPPAG